MSRSILQQRNINLVPITNESAIIWNTDGISSDVNNWTQLYSLLQRIQVPVYIYLDKQPSDPPFVIPEGTWNLNNSYFISKTSDPQTILVEDGAVIQNLAGIDGLIMSFQNTAPVIVDPSRIFKLYNAVLSLAGSAPVFTLSVAASPFYLQMRSAVISGAAGSTLISLGAGSAFAVQLFEGSQFDTNIVTGPVGSVLQYEHNGSTDFPLPTQTGMLGTIVNAALGVSGGAGPTSQRPLSPTLGTSYFDTDLPTPIPIWWDGSVWVDATGTAV